MSNPHESLHLADEARRGLCDAFRGLQTKAGQFHIPLSDSQDRLAQCLKELLENRSVVSLVGEKKRGKSSTANALIGRDILPTDELVATCVLYLIRNCEREEYRLRFKDGSHRVVTLEEAQRVGSQQYYESQREAGIIVATA